MTSIIDVRNLCKTYVAGMRRRRVDAVSGISFQVEAGESFGFLGPNGAGKTTTIRMLMGLIAPTAGSASLFGHKIPSRRARHRLGFLPEAPYFYDYLSVAELLDLSGRIFGLERKLRRKRCDELIELVGLEHARNSPLKSYSKGMMQRAGIAQALVNDPELVVFDEPMSGLDPVGRKEVRDIILSLREQDKSVFFSSHILADVETVANRIAIIVQGRLHDVGRLRDLVSTVAGTEIVVRLPEEADEAEAKLSRDSVKARRHHGELTSTLGPESDVDAFVRGAHELGCKLVSVVPIHETLEDVFVRAAADQRSYSSGSDRQKDAAGGDAS